ncbi:hypothetical protein [Aromatoleum evansii]|uniref:hypothetical protein n=1 Tax=Aromatoleum evansii TaxID=59406 RepID=UPI00145DF30D|nr:hypothetical protein [Aromatoleum evansii]NMG32370.1 hypothetical protein [Aromatoleum evansii]
MADINDTTPVPYSAFASEHAYELHHIRAKLSGLMALVKEIKGWDNDHDDCVPITYLFDGVMSDLETIACAIDDSELHYTLKQQ